MGTSMLLGLLASFWKGEASVRDVRLDSMSEVQRNPGAKLADLCRRRVS